MQVRRVDFDATLNWLHLCGIGGSIMLPFMQDRAGMLVCISARGMLINKPMACTYATSFTRFIDLIKGFKLWACNLISTDHIRPTRRHNVMHKYRMQDNTDIFFLSVLIKTLSFGIQNLGDCSMQNLFSLMNRMNGDRPAKPWPWSTQTYLGLQYVVNVLFFI